MLTAALARFPRLQLIPQATALQHLPRLSQHLGRDIWIKRDDLTPLALGGNKARKLEYLAADAQGKGADVLVTADAIQSNHVRQTAAVAAQLGLGCLALLENPIDSQSDDYLGNGNRLLLDLFGAEVENVATTNCWRPPANASAQPGVHTWYPSAAPMPWAHSATCVAAWSWHWKARPRHTRDRRHRFAQRGGTDDGHASVVSGAHSMCRGAQCMTAVSGARQEQLKTCKMPGRCRESDSAGCCMTSTTSTAKRARKI